MASPFVNNLTQNGRLSIRRAEPDGGASHDDLDGGKMGDKRIRMGGKAGALGRGVKREKDLQWWADMALQVARVAGEADS